MIKLLALPDVLSASLAQHGWSLTSTYQMPYRYATKKYKKFLKEPMTKKDVFGLPGIGSRNGERLIRAGFNNADDVFDKYLEYKGDKSSFIVS